MEELVGSRDRLCRRARQAAKIWKRAHASSPAPAPSVVTVPAESATSSQRSWRSQIEQIVGELAATTPAASQVPELHELRIRVKRLRYAIELVGPRVDGKLASRVVASLTTLQRTLGRLNDAAVLQELIAARLKRAVARQRTARAKILKGLLKSIDADVASAASDSAGIWSRRRERICRDVLDCLASDTTVPVARSAAAAVTSLAGASSRGGSVAHTNGVHPSPGRRGGLAALIGAPVNGSVTSHGLAWHPQQTLAPAAMADANQGSAARGDGELSQGGIPAAHGPAVGDQSNGRAGAVRIAAIDIGTNSIRLIVAEATPDGAYRVLDDEKELARLGRGMDEKGKLDSKLMESGAGVVAKMVRIAQGYGAKYIRAVATAAVREATNGAQFCEMASARAGVQIEIISAEQEAQLGFDSAARAFDLTGMSVAVIDIGGGSTELVHAVGGTVERMDLLPIGAVKLTERFGGPKKASGKRFEELREWVRKFVNDNSPATGLNPQLLIGTGGTITTLGSIVMERSGAGGKSAPSGALRGFEVKRSDLKRVLRDLLKMPVSKRGDLPGLPAERADIIVPGLALLDAICKRVGCKRIRVHDGGIRDGLLLTMVRELFPAAPRLRQGVGDAGDIVSIARRFAASCKYDAAHSEHVGRLAASLFDQLAAAARAGMLPPSLARKMWVFDDANKDLLQAAALMLDVGYLINYERHHVHSASLILHGGLAGASRRDLHILAAIARYHRGSLPKDSHSTLAAMPQRDRDVVSHLAAIVRIAVGLDRTHTQLVSAVRAVVSAGGIRFVVQAPADPSVDLWGAQRKAEMFREIFALEPTFTWAGARAERATAHA